MAATAVSDVAGAVALVTGASSGLGERFARVLAANGAKVALAGRRAMPSTGSPARSRRPAGPRRSFPSTSATATGFRRLRRGRGGLGPVTVLASNAGIAGGGTIADLTYEAWREILDVDLDAFLMSKEGARRMTAGASIVNVASILGLRPRAAHGAYSAAKAGVVQLSRIMALELAPAGVRVNTLAPGYVVTGMNRAFFARRRAAARRRDPLGRVGQVDDFDGAILFLASAASRFMTGATLVIDGGHTMVL